MGQSSRSKFLETFCSCNIYSKNNFKSFLTTRDSINIKGTFMLNKLYENNNVVSWL